jgi:hypothetical protein
MLILKSIISINYLGVVEINPKWEAIMEKIRKLKFIQMEY